MNKKILISVGFSFIFTSTLFGLDKLDNVIVTSKSNKEVLDVAGSASIITAKDIKRMNASSIEEILEEVVGLNTGVNSSSIFGRKTISVRGLDSKNSLILIDGRRVSGTDAQIGHSDFQYNWLPIDAIERIEVVRGPMSSLYGSKALGGVVNIITKQPKDEIASTIDIETGSPSHDRGGNENSFSFTSAGKINDKLSFALFAENKKEEITNEKDDTNATEHEGKKVKNLMLNGWYNIDDTQSINLTALLSNEVRSTNDYLKYYDIQKRHYSINYNKDFEDFALKLNYYKTKSDSHPEQFSYTHKLEDDVINAEIVIDSIKSNHIILGAELRKESYEKIYDKKESSAGNFSDDISYKSVFIQDEIDLSDDFILTVGSRYDKHENFGAEISPKAYLVYKMSENSRIKGGYGHGFSAPTVTQSSDAYQFRNYYAGHGFDGNSNLKPESSDSYELGYEYDNNGTSFKSTVFYNDITDLIETTNTGTEANSVCATWVFGPCPFPDPITIQQYNNVSKAVTKGLELEYSKDNVIDGLDFDINYTYLKTEDKDTGKELKLKPTHKINSKITYVLPYDVETTFRYKYTGKQKDADYETLGAYSTFALQLSKEFSKALTVRTGIENMGNKQLDDSYDYQIRARYYYVGLNYKF